MNETLILGALALVSPVVAIVLYNKFGPKGQNSSASAPAVAEANAQAKEIVLEAKNEALKITQSAQEAVQKLAAQKAQTEAKDKQLEAERNSIETQKQNLQTRKEELDKIISEEQSKLEKTAGLSKDEARKQLLESFQRELAQDKGKLVRQMEDEAKHDADEKAREILVYAMRQASTDYVVEYSSSKVKLPDEDLKGRIIGKEGRNIRAFEELTGVELELDESPGEIIISSFDPVRREVAKISLERLIADGRIQPAKIEEIVQKTQADIDKIIYKEGDNLCHRLGVYNLPNEIVGAIGRFKYRFSYGQNMIEHTLEVAKIGMAIAAEVGANSEIVKLGCLLHDIGKVFDLSFEAINPQIVSSAKGTQEHKNDQNKLSDGCKIYSWKHNFYSHEVK